MTAGEETGFQAAAPLVAKIKQHALALGFDQVGIAPVRPSLFKTAYQDWLSHGYHADMHYMAREPERRLNPAALLPNAKSIVVTATNYAQPPEEAHPESALFARYARNEDYHHVIERRLQELLRYIQQAADIPVAGRVYVDTGPLLEREIAMLAGLGWFGKNTMLITPRAGSYFLLGELLLDLRLPPDSPTAGGCGNCTRCLDACPTQAIVRPYQVDSRLCISYLTIENKGPIPASLQARIGNRVFGCDICQEVCPFNARWARPTSDPAFLPRPATTNRLPEELLRLSEEEFREEFRGSPVKRAKRRGLARNAAASLSLRHDPAAQSALRSAMNDQDELVRTQAALALDSTNSHT